MNMSAKKRINVLRHGASNAVTSTRETLLTLLRLRRLILSFQRSCYRRIKIKFFSRESTKLRDSACFSENNYVNFQIIFIK